MFVYIFCIIWATIFAYLAERQFKRVPIATKSKNKRKKSFRYASNTKHSAESAVVREDVDQDGMGQENVKYERIETDESLPTVNQELPGKTLDLNDAEVRLNENTMRDKGCGTIISDFVYPDQHYAEQVRKNIVHQKMPLNAGPASQEYRSLEGSAYEHDYNYDNDESIGVGEAGNIMINVSNVEKQKRIKKEGSRKEHQRDSSGRKLKQGGGIKERYVVGLEIFRREDTNNRAQKVGKKVISAQTALCEEDKEADDNFHDDRADDTHKASRHKSVEHIIGEVRDGEN